MNILRAIGLGIVLWVLVFFEVSALMFGLKLTQGSIYYYILHGIFITIFYFLLTYIYFRGKEIKKGFVQGLTLGFIWLALSIILDSLITIPLFVKNYAFLVSPELLISELWGIIVCIIMSVARIYKVK